MLKKFSPLFISAILMILPNISYALRCGNDLVSIGDLKQEVILSCGKPESKEIIGYIDKERDGDRIRVLNIEEWILKIQGNYHSLIFEGNKLNKIESVGSN